MKIRVSLLALCCFLLVTNASLKAEEIKPIKALLIAGGCCHDYTEQQKILSKGISERAYVRVDVYWTDDKSTAPNFPIYQNDNWAEGYDVIIHDECAANIKDIKIAKRIIKAHEKIPSVNLHCAMHSYRTGTDDWFKYIGLQSTGHGPKVPMALTIVDKKHPILIGQKDWVTIPEELYNNKQMYDAHPLIRGKQTFVRRGKTETQEYVVAWTNEKQGAKNFCTTIGHMNDTVADDRYLNLVTRGLLWSCDKLEESYLKPYKGKNTVTFIKAAKKPLKPVPAKKGKKKITPKK